MGQIDEENGGERRRGRATETKIKACIQKARHAEIRMCRKMSTSSHGRQYTVKSGVLQGEEQKHIYLSRFTQSLAALT